MNPLPRIAASVFVSLAALAFTGVAHAQHAERCEPIPKEQWKPKADLERKLVNEGWKIRRVKIENGCYEVYAHDEKGRKVEAFFHPKTFDRVYAPK